MNAEQANVGEHDAAGGDDARGTEAIDWAAENRRRLFFDVRVVDNKAERLALAHALCSGPNDGVLDERNRTRQHAPPFRYVAPLGNDGPLW